MKRKRTTVPYFDLTECIQWNSKLATSSSEIVFRYLGVCFCGKPPDWNIFCICSADLCATCLPLHQSKTCKRCDKPTCHAKKPICVVCQTSVECNECLGGCQSCEDLFHEDCVENWECGEGRNACGTWCGREGCFQGIECSKCGKYQRVCSEECLEPFGCYDCMIAENS